MHKDKFSKLLSRLKTNLSSSKIIDNTMQYIECIRNDCATVRDRGFRGDVIGISNARAALCDSWK